MNGIQLNMSKAFVVRSKLVNEEILNDIVSLLKSEGPLYIKEIALRVRVSPNTAGKYVDILQARGTVRIDKYATAKRVLLIEGN